MCRNEYPILCIDMFAFIAYFKARLQALIKDQKKRSFALLYIHDISFERIEHFVSNLL